MPTSDWFDDLPVIGRLSPTEAAAKLRQMGEDETADSIEAAQHGTRTSADTFGLSELLGFGEKPWQYTAHAFGYLAPSLPGDHLLRIQHAGNIAGDASLKNSRVKIALNRLRVADYPGSGTHHVLFDFYAQNQLPGEVEHLHFNATFRVLEGQQAAIINYPIFIGLNVGSEGVAFKCLTVNVKNEQDEAFLGFLESEVFQSGLKLATVAQPAIAPLSQMAIGLTKSIAKRNRNVPVQEFSMGLDFTSNAFGARLAEGDYIAVQIPSKMRTIWDWDEWVYNPRSGEIVNNDDHAQMIPYNYIVFSINRYAGL
jgi:hypothetical protein